MNGKIKQNIKKFCNEQIKKRLQEEFPNIQFLEDERAYCQCIECGANSRAVARVVDKRGKPHRFYWCHSCGMLWMRSSFQCILYKQRLLWKKETHNLHKIRGEKQGVKR